MYTSFGLGYGVDATDPAPLRSKHGRVRKVLLDLANVEETMKKERRKYEETISSIVSYSASVSLSVSDLVAKSLTLSAEGELSRERSREMIATGKFHVAVTHDNAYGFGIRQLPELESKLWSL